MLDEQQEILRELPVDARTRELALKLESLGVRALAERRDE
jgi:hypothetical protein